MEKINFKKNKKGISGVVSAVLLIGIAIGAVIVVGTFIMQMIETEKDEILSCSEIPYDGGIKIEGRYSCMNTSTDELRFNINLDDVKLSKIELYLIDGSGDTFKKIEMEDNKTFSNLKEYGSDYNEEISLPTSHGAKTYSFNNSENNNDIEEIKIIPIYLGGEHCDTEKTLSNIKDCELL